jgi:hypothetical protein
MAKSFSKVLPVISQPDFLSRAGQVKSFTSSNGKRYEVDKVEEDIMSFRRLDAKSLQVWTMDLKQLYKAYFELNDFVTENFRPYVPITHSPARGLLIHLGLLA